MSVYRRNAFRATAAGALALILASPWSAIAQSVLRLVPQADLKILDTVQTTNNITSNHGYMVYDTLFSLDGKLAAKPQMVESYSKSPDSLTWKFKLRPGLKFHDGQAVTAKDAVASILRFSKRIPAGVTMMQFAKEIVTTGGDTFEIRLNKPFGLVLETLAGPENPLFVTREADAQLDPNTAMTTAIGSGPFIFVREEWVPGSKVVYKKNPDYKPRSEPADGFAGGKLAKVDRVEWLVIPDSNTAVQALIKGEVDIIEIPQTDLLPLVRKDPNITVKVIDRVGTQAIYRMNHLIPPFNNAKARQALLYATGDQKDYMSSMIGFAECEKPCGRGHTDKHRTPNGAYGTVSVCVGGQEEGQLGAVSNRIHVRAGWYGHARLEHAGQSGKRGLQIGHRRACSRHAQSHGCMVGLGHAEAKRLLDLQREALKDRLQPGKRR